MPPSVQRRPGTADAAVLGLATMLGAGVFGVWAPAVAAAGPWVLLAVVVAGIAALCSAASGTDLALAQPASRGCCVAHRDRMPPAAGRLAGVAFIVGRAAAAAAAARVFGDHVLPAHATTTAVLVIVAVTGVNLAGVRWTVRGAWAYVGGVLVVLVVVVLTGLTSAGGAPPGTSAAAAVPVGLPTDPGGPSGVLTAAGLLFFAYAGFARVPTLGDAVRDSRRTLPRAVVVAVALAAVVYLLVAGALLLGLGAAWLAAEPAPLVAVVDEGGAPALGVLVRVGAAVAAGSALLSVLAGVSRTAATMARRGELPRAMGVAGPWGTPWRSDVAGGLAAVLIALLAGSAAAITLAACALLVHYAVLGLTALRLPAAGRAWPAWTSAVGTALCLVLVAVLPLREVLTTAAVLAAGWVVCTLLGRRAPAG